MPLIRCPDCVAEVSDRAPACPKCGAPIAAIVAAIGSHAPEQVGAATSAIESPQGAAVTQIPPGGYQPVLPPREIRSLGVLIGLALTGFGFYGALSWIPEHDPANLVRTGDILGTVSNIAIQSARDARYLKPELVGTFTFAAWTFASLGVLQLLTGSTRRVGRLAFCKPCGMQVVARKRTFGWCCERCDAPA